MLLAKAVDYKLMFSRLRCSVLLEPQTVYAAIARCHRCGVTYLIRLSTDSGSLPVSAVKLTPLLTVLV